MNRQTGAILILSGIFLITGASALVQSHPISEIVVDTTDLVDNLNADLLDGHEGSYYQDTNAQTICPDGKTLDGSGNCVSSSSNIGDGSKNLEWDSCRSTAAAGSVIDADTYPTSCSVSCSSDQVLVTSRTMVRATGISGSCSNFDWWDGWVRTSNRHFHKNGLKGEGVTVEGSAFQNRVCIKAVIGCGPAN